MLCNESIGDVGQRDGRGDEFNGGLAEEELTELQARPVGLT